MTFSQYNLDFDKNIFKILSETSVFDDISKGRKGAILVNSVGGLIPIVRSTSSYVSPAQQFKDIHYEIIKKINEFLPAIEFNNAMIEIYNNNYRTMKYHTDQSLDLAENSFICIFSCYSNPETKNIRKLIIKEKDSDIESEILLKHNSVVVFSIDTNKKYLHKIVLDEKCKDDTLWLGITLRKSKTCIKFIDDIPYFENNKILRLANSEEKMKFMIMKGNENQMVDFHYPDIDYTISPSDLINTCK